jgi:hypothetical protein
MDCVLKAAQDRGGTKWTPAVKTAHLIAALNEPTANILHRAPTGATYKEVTEVLKNHYWDHYLKEAFHAQLRRSVQHTREPLQEFAGTTDHLAHHAYVDLTEQLISREAAHAFADGVRKRGLR